MRRPTWFGRLKLLARSTTSTDEVLFLRNPDFQLRDLGAAAPLVSFKRNVRSSCSRHPLMVTDAVCAAALSDDAPALATGADVISNGSGLLAMIEASEVGWMNGMSADFGAGAAARAGTRSSDFTGRASTTGASTGGRAV